MAALKINDADEKRKLKERQRTVETRSCTREERRI